MRLGLNVSLDNNSDQFGRSRGIDSEGAGAGADSFGCGRVALGIGGFTSSGVLFAHTTRIRKARSIRRLGLYLTSTLGSGPRLFAEIPGGTLPPKVIPKFVTPLVIPPAMPLANSDGGADFYRIAVRQFRQQILPAPWPRTTVWSYGAVDYPATFNYPAFTIEATADRATRVTWINQLVDGRGRYLPHLLAVDQTLHWANPPGGPTGRDSRGHDPEPYLGPVPIVTHLHGGHSGDESDGFAEAWFLPPANNIPAGYATQGTWYDHFKAKFAAKWGGTWTPGSATFHHANDQRAATLWYHDHALGMTRLNVYAGPAGFLSHSGRSRRSAARRAARSCPGDR